MVIVVSDGYRQRGLDVPHVNQKAKMKRREGIMASAAFPKVISVPCCSHVFPDLGFYFVEKAFDSVINCNVEMKCALETKCDWRKAFD